MDSSEFIERNVENRWNERRAHKQALSDAQFQEKHNEIQGMIENLQTQVAAVPDKNSPDYLKAKDQLAQALQARDEHWKSLDHPNAILKFGKMLGKDLHFPQKEATPAVAPPVYGQPTMDVNGEKVPTGSAYRVQGPQTPQQTKSAAEANQLVAAGPLSPEQQATTTANAQSAGSLASIQSAMKNYETLTPNATPQEKQAFLTDLIQKAYGTTTRGSWTTVAGKINGQPASFLFDKNTHQYRTQSGDAVPVELLDQFVPDIKTTEASNKRADFDAFKKAHPEYQGTFEQWTAEQSGLGRNAAIAAKPPNRDDRYIAILQKAGQGQTLTPDDIAYKGAYDLWVQVTKVNPGVARMMALNDNRYTWVYDMNDPSKNLHPMRMKDAAKSPVGSPQNIAFKTDTAISRAFTSGAPATTINYFNTAIEHLNLLKEATEALNNGNIQMFNQLTNRWSTATGSPAPNNFDTVRNAVAGELSKTFKGTGATDEEIANISGTINNAQSPDQLYGGIDYDLHLMNGKMQALKGQFEAGKQGRPNFPGSTPPPPPPGLGGPTPKGKGSTPKGATHRVEYPPKSGKWFYADKAGNNLGEVR